MICPPIRFTEQVSSVSKSSSSRTQTHSTRDPGLVQFSKRDGQDNAFYEDPYLMVMNNPLYEEDTNHEETVGDGIESSATSSVPIVRDTGYVDMRPVDIDATYMDMNATTRTPLMSTQSTWTQKT
eukprot:TRINITY_DN12536_c0_g3_i1.p6 TRINITY_DN12536_c0_g3~~TRINITY_DN12536_c0_g3_i1.p6  ORF type:complete len:125 (+),score=18.85 TRINITY_DN12536_c0_g3_i1:1367-1741(+)